MTGHFSSPAPAASLSASIRAAQQWWIDAGVETACGDSVVPWIVEEPVEDSTAVPVFFVDNTADDAAALPPAIGGDEDGWPQDLLSFQDWWLNAPSLDCGGLRPRIAPRGTASPELMIIVPMPEGEDEDSLLSGVHGRLVRGICSALNLGVEDVYLASALPRYVQLPDWDALDSAGLGAVLRHHVGLVKPQRLLAMGHGILPLLQHGSPKDLPQTDQFRLLGTSAPEILLRTPRLRAALWRQLLDWTEA